jgi:broad specificity phosphatase PhoE
MVTEFRRTQDTAKPIAAKLGLTPEVVKAAETPDLLSRLKTKHVNDVVLVVGHSNTIPAIIKALTGRDVNVADSEYDDLFFVVPASGAVSRIKYAPAQTASPAERSRRSWQGRSPARSSASNPWPARFSRVIRPT